LVEVVISTRLPCIRLGSCGGLGAVYVPEQFPAVIYKVDDNKTSFLIFNSGRVVIAGARSMAHLNEAAERIAEKLRMYSY